MISWDDVVKVASKLMLKIETGALFRQAVKKNLHTRKTNGAVPTNVCTNAAHALTFR